MSPNRVRVEGHSFILSANKKPNYHYTLPKVVYYESIKQELKIRPIYECRYDERLKLKLRNLHVSHTLVCE